MEQETRNPPTLLTTPQRLGKWLARVAFGVLLGSIALYFGDQAAEVTRLPFSTLALRDLLNGLLMAMMCVIFACWAVITVLGTRRRKRSGNEKGGTP